MQVRCKSDVCPFKNKFVLLPTLRYVLTPQHNFKMDNKTKRLIWKIAQLILAALLGGGAGVAIN